MVDTTSMALLRMGMGYVRTTQQTNSTIKLDRRHEAQKRVIGTQAGF